MTLCIWNTRYERELLPQQRVINDQITASNWSLTKQKFACMPADDRNKIALCQQSGFILFLKSLNTKQETAGRFYKRDLQSIYQGKLK